LFLWDVADGRRISGSGGGIHRLYASAAAAQNLREGFLEGEEWLVCHWREGPPR
jgi:hypothetical protein